MRMKIMKWAIARPRKSKLFIYLETLIQILLKFYSIGEILFKNNN